MRATASFAAALALLVPGAVMAAAAPASPVQAPASAEPFSLAPLPYAFEALEPAIDAQTMRIHHGRHHQAYVNNLNAAVKATSVPGPARLTGCRRPLPRTPRRATPPSLALATTRD